MQTIKFEVMVFGCLVSEYVLELLLLVAFALADVVVPYSVHWWGFQWNGRGRNVCLIIFEAPFPPVQEHKLPHAGSIC